MAKGFGLKPFGYGPFGLPLAPPTPSAPSALSSSRKIDGIAGRYVVNDVGGFQAMDDTAQRVLLAVSFALKPRAPFITTRDLAAQETAIRAALAFLTSGQEPAIRLIAVAAAKTGPNATSLKVRFKNLLTGTEQTLEPARSTSTG
jgi:hypothetical protein